MLPKLTGINNHTINLDGGLASARPICNLGLLNLEILKAYLEINFASGFIRLSKSPACAPILFVWKPNGNFLLCINYWGLNNLITKDWYLFLLLTVSEPVRPGQNDLYSWDEDRKWRRKKGGFQNLV